MADNQDFSEDMAHGDFSNESCGDFQDQNSNQAHDQTSNDATSNGDQPTDASEKHKEEASHNSHADHSQDGPQSKDEDRKLFVGGLSWSTTDKDLKEHFGKYGDIESVTVKMDPQTGRSRGFAFLIFKNAEALDKVIAAGEHVIGGKRVDPKKAKARSGKIFVGGLPQDCSEETIRSFFGQYGRITEVEMPFDRVKNQRKNFCFVTFENETVVFELLKTPKQVINGKEVDVKKATPKLDNFGPPPTRGGRGGGGGGPGSMRGAPRGRGSWGGWGPQGGYGGGGGYGYDGYGYDYYGGDYGYGGGYGDYYGGAQGGYGGGKQRGGRQAPRHQPY